MIFTLNKEEKRRIDKLIKTSYYNDSIADFLNDHVIGFKYDSNLSLNSNISIDKLDLKKYKNNLYNLSKIEEKKHSKYKIKYQTLNKFTCFLYDEIKVDANDYFLINNKVGYFTSDYKYLTIEKNNIVWMSIIPHEINTMNISILDSEEINILGLGLGYFPFIHQNKFKKMNIIELDNTIIDLFKTTIEPKLDYHGKLNIINDDALEFVKNIKNKNSPIYVDLYHNPKDGLKLYYHLKKILGNRKNVYFWIEESILAYFRRLFITLIEEELYYNDEVNYDNINCFEDEIINRLHLYFKNKKISTYVEIKLLLESKNLKELIINI